MRTATPFGACVHSWAVGLAWSAMDPVSSTHFASGRCADRYSLDSVR